MRERIGQALGEKLSENPENAYLLRQQMLLPSAQICTMDSFCNTLVKQYFHELDIAPDFRLADDSERRALEDTVLVLKSCTQTEAILFRIFPICLCSVLPTEP